MIIALDFDGTVLTHSYPNLGKDIGAVPVLKELIAKGHHLILWTMRCDSQEAKEINGYEIFGGDFLTQAVNWFRDNDIPLYGIQKNPTQHEWTTSPKCYAHLIIDDTMLGCPLEYNALLSDRPFVAWDEIRKMLEARGLI